MLKGGNSGSEREDRRWLAWEKVICLNEDARSPETIERKLLERNVPFERHTIQGCPCVVFDHSSHFL